VSDLLKHVLLLNMSGLKRPVVLLDVSFSRGLRCSGRVWFPEVCSAPGHVWFNEI
jgi:hypothetical protein